MNLRDLWTPGLRISALGYLENTQRYMPYSIILQAESLTSFYAHWRIRLAWNPSRNLKCLCPLKIHFFFLGKGHISLSVSILKKSLKPTQLIKHYLFSLCYKPTLWCQRTPSKMSLVHVHFMNLYVSMLFINIRQIRCNISNWRNLQWT